MSFFLAIDLDERVREEVWSAASPHHALPAKWLRRDKLHLTLIFLGEPTPERRAGLQAEVAAAVRGQHPFSLRVAGAGHFETARAPGVLWLGVEGALEPLRALQAALSVALQAELDRPYVPHVTLARAKDRAAIEALAAQLSTFRSSEWEIAHVTFYESTSSHYLPLWKVPLTAS